MIFAAVATPETIGDKLALGGNTTLIGMGIVFMVLIALWLIVVIEHKIIEGVSGAVKGKTSAKAESVAVTATTAEAPVAKNGSFTGNADVTGVTDDETLAVILATVSTEANIPMDEIKVTDIKAL